MSEQVGLCEIPAPPFAEQERAQAFRAALERLGLRNVRIDAVGNVLGERSGRQSRPHVVMSAHLDTVFPEGTNVKTTRSGATIAGPGIGRLPGSCRSARRHSRDGQGRIETAGSVTFVGTVGGLSAPLEEGSTDANALLLTVALAR
jgi:tripeptide aminopeptidase